MFRGIREEAADRILTTRTWLQSALSAGDDLPLSGGGHESTTKGLVIVLLWATYENTVYATVTAAMQCFNREEIPLCEVRDEMLPLALSSEVESVRNTTKLQKIWSTRTKLFAAAVSTEPAEVRDGLFPSDGSNLQHSQLVTIWEAFGISVAANPPLPHPRIGRTLETIRLARHDVAHGRSTAAEVGGRYSEAEIASYIDDFAALCDRVPQVVGEHCRDMGNFRRPTHS